MSIRLELLDVTVRLEPEHGVTSLACINFIKSRLLVEIYSDLSQDIDLVSQVAIGYVVCPHARTPARPHARTHTLIHPRVVCRRSW